MDFTLLDLSEAKRKILAERSLRLSNSAGEWADVFTGIKTASGKIVSREQAMRCSSVLACTRILMEDTASLPLLLKVKTDIGAKDAIDHPLYRLLKSAPNELQTSVEVREHIIMDMILSGHFAVWQQRDGRGALKALYPLCAQFLTFQGQQKNGDLVWKYGQQGFPSEFTNQQLWRGSIMAQSIIDGRSLILLAREAIGLAVAAEEQGARLFSNGIQTNIVFQTDADLDEADKNQLRESLASTNAGTPNSWKALILDNGLTAEKIGLTAQESQYIEARNYQLSDIARVFRVPPVLIGIESKTSSYASAEQFFQSYVKHTLMPWAVRIEQTIERDLLLPSETRYFVKHQFASLLRADQKTRYECYQLGINAGWMNREEPRVSEDLDTVPGLDKFLVPANMQILNADGTVPTPPPSANTPGTPGTPNKPTNPNTRLADNIADTINRSEVREFTKHGEISNSGWHIGKVMDLTGVSIEAAKGYSDWRRGLEDPLSDVNCLEARQRIINLCLGVTL